MSQQFEGQVAWITGGGSGIGRAIALELAERGADVAVSGRRQAKLDEVVAEIEARGRRGLAVTCDVSDPEAVERAVATVVAELGRLDVAVANAGWAISGSIERLTADDWRRQLDVNVIGVAMTARYALPELRKTKGRLGLIGSVVASMTIPNNGAYAASKYAVRAIGQTLSMELHGSGVSCTTIHPGFVASEINQVDNQGVHHPDRVDRRPKKLMWPADKAAVKVVNALYRRKREHTFTGHGKAGAFLGKHTPGLVHFMVTRFGGNEKAKKIQREKGA